MAAMGKAAQYVVTAPLVAATVGKTVLHFRAGDVLPAGVDDASIDNLKSLGFVSESDAAGSSDPSDPASDGEPPRAGRGSGVEAWAEYATSKGIEVPADATRDDIVALVDASK